MADWRDVMNARDAADALAKQLPDMREDIGGVIVALLSLRLELRALGTLLDYARGDAR